MADKPQPVEPADYARDIPAVLRQKLLHAAAMMSRRFRFHPRILSPRPPRLHPRRARLASCGASRAKTLGKER